jgi:hypothetical protein
MKDRRSQSNRAGYKGSVIDRSILRSVKRLTVQEAD